MTEGSILLQDCNVLDLQDDLSLSFLLASFLFLLMCRSQKLFLKNTCSYENIGVNHLGGSDQPK